MSNSTKNSSTDCLTCCVPQCGNTTKNATNVEFYRFPTTNSNYPHRIARLKDWLKALKLELLDGSAWVPTKKSRICSAHFVGNKKSDDPRSPSYNPTLFPPIYKKSVVNSEQVLNRYKRALKRSKQLSTDISTSKKRKIEIVPMDHSTVHGNMASNDDNLLENNHTNEIEPLNNIEVTPVKVYVDVGVQIDFLSEDIFQDTFICNRYIFPSTCEVETLCYAAGSKGRVKIETKKETESKCQAEVSCNKGFHGYESIKHEQALVDLAGVRKATFELFVKIFLRDQSKDCTLSDLRKKVSNENRILIFLMKMKCGLTFSALSVFFNIHRTTVSRIFYSMLDYFSVACRNFVKWPDKLVVQQTLPLAFQDEYSDCRVIIDATEFCVEQPPSVDEKVHFFSLYKKGYRIKVVIGCTPGGFISLISQSHGGRDTDAQITVGSQLLNLLEPGDKVLADKGFPQIKSILDEKGENVLVVMPPFLHENQQFTKDEVQETYKVASVRIHIERIMQRLRTHKILEKLSTEMLPFIDKIIFMSCVLVNLQRPIIKENPT